MAEQDLSYASGSAPVAKKKNRFFSMIAPTGTEGYVPSYFGTAPIADTSSPIQYTQQRMPTEAMMVLSDIFRVPTQGGEVTHPITGALATTPEEKESYKDLAAQLRLGQYETVAFQPNLMSMLGNGKTERLSTPSDEDYYVTQAIQPTVMSPQQYKKLLDTGQLENVRQYWNDILKQPFQDYEAATGYRSNYYQTRGTKSANLRQMIS